MGLGRKTLPMEISTGERTLMESLMVMEITIGTLVEYIEGSSILGLGTDWVNTPPLRTRSTLVIMQRIRRMDRANIHGPMEPPILVNLWMIRDMELVQ